MFSHIMAGSNDIARSKKFIRRVAMANAPPERPDGRCPRY
jgi:hypothetical protein